MLGAYSGLMNMFVNFYDVEARCAIFFYLSTLSNQNYEYFTNCMKWLLAIKGRISNILLLCYKRFEEKLPDAPAIKGWSMIGLKNLFLYQSSD